MSDQLLTQAAIYQFLLPPLDPTQLGLAIERALEVAPAGFEQYIIAAADTVMSRPNAELLAEVFPDVPVTREVGPNETLLSIEKATRMLGYAPQHSWREGH